MLVYIATYPRAGNSWLRSMVRLNWHYLVGNGYPTDWQRLKEGAAAEGFTVFAEDAGSFTYRHPEADEPRRALKPDALARLTPALREELAAGPALAFVKTHELPFERYFAGEKAIQMVRHPTDAAASWVEMQRLRKAGPRPLAHLVEGVAHARWGDYHDRWGAASLPLWRTRFEDALADEAAVTTWLAGFLGLPEPGVTAFFGRQQARNPERYRQGRQNRWPVALTPKEARMVWEAAMPQAGGFGYGDPLGGEPAAPPA